MVGSTLIEIRDHIETLAAEDGQYSVICGRTGERSVPAAGKRFPTRATAHAAARATEQYRSALRRYDPRVPYYDLIVCEEPPLDSMKRHRQCSTTDPDEYTLSEPILTETPTPGHGDLVEFCHRVAGAVFEALSGSGYDSIENAVMDAYFELAEAVGDPGELCLCLLESMASELDARLSVDEQAEILIDAAGRLKPIEDADAPIDATLDELEQRGLIESYMRSPYSVDLDGGARSAVVQISGYALSAHDDRLPVLPLTLELCRHHTEQSPQSVQVTTIDDGWKLMFGLENMRDQNGLVSAQIEEEEE